MNGKVSTRHACSQPPRRLGLVGTVHFVRSQVVSEGGRRAPQEDAEMAGSRSAPGS